MKNETGTGVGGELPGKSSVQTTFRGCINERHKGGNFTSDFVAGRAIRAGVYNRRWNKKKKVDYTSHFGGSFFLRFL